MNFGEKVAALEILLAIILMAIINFIINLMDLMLETKGE